MYPGLLGLHKELGDQSHLDTSKMGSDRGDPICKGHIWTLSRCTTLFSCHIMLFLTSIIHIDLRGCCLYHQHLINLLVATSPYRAMNYLLSLDAPSYLHFSHPNH